MPIKVRTFALAALSAVLVIALVAMPALADTLRLKDGTTVEGRVIDQGSAYWIKPATGASRTIPKDQVTAWEKEKSGAPSPLPTAKPTAPGVAAPTQPSNAAAAGQATGNFQQTKAKADRVDVPLVAVGMWQTWIDSNPTSPELEAAKKEQKLEAASEGQSRARQRQMGWRRRAEEADEAGERPAARCRRSERRQQDP